MIYLVLNVENYKERWVLDICTTLEKAEKLKEEYCNNFRQNKYDCDIIKIEPVPITDSEIIWSYEETGKEDYE